MGFWGIEVKPGETYTHSHDTNLGILRIKQATLGNGNSKEKSTLQCIVSNKGPLLLCSLIPDVSESFPLDLEFEKAEQVSFSIFGERSIILSGYFVGSGRETCGCFPVSFTSVNMNIKNPAENAAGSNYQTLDEHKERMISDICCHPEPAKDSCPTLDTSTQPECGDDKRRVMDTKPEDNGSHQPAVESLTASLNHVLGDISQPGKVLDPLKDVLALTKQLVADAPLRYKSRSERLRSYARLNVQDSMKEKNKIISKHSDTNEQMMEMPVPLGWRMTGQPSSVIYGCGLSMRELALGKQNVKRSFLGKKVYVHYTGWIENGEVFATTGSGEPLGFRLGMGQVMRGWDLAMQGMYVGDIRRICICPYMGYDNTMNWEIPENSIVLFDIELVDVE